MTESAKNFITGPQAIQPDEPPAELSQLGLAPPTAIAGVANQAPCLELAKSESQTDQSPITDPVEDALPYKSVLQTDAHLELTSLKEEVCKQVDEYWQIKKYALKQILKNIGLFKKCLFLLIPELEDPKWCFDLLNKVKTIQLMNLVWKY